MANIDAMVIRLVRTKTLKQLRKGLQLTLDDPDPDGLGPAAAEIEAYQGAITLKESGKADLILICAACALVIGICAVVNALTFSE